VRDERIAGLTRANILPGITSLLDEARAHHVRLLCISTNSATATILHRLGLHDRFTRIIAGDDLTPPKNDSAACLLRELSALGCAPDDALYLDDSRRACTHAAAAGIPTVYVGNGAPVRGAVQRPSLADEQLLALYECATGALAR
jgi:HAD superfamily hydrolase (TIGR01509 family)